MTGEEGSTAGAAVSVVIPVGGLDPMLPMQLAAVLGQVSPLAFDVIFSINNPDPDTATAVAALIKQTGDARVRSVDSAERRGAAHARNVGWRSSAAEMVAFCDADDRVHDGWLAALIDGLATFDAVSGKVIDVFPDQRMASWHPPATPGDLPQFLGHAYVLSGNLAARRSALEAVSGFDERLTRCEDIAIGWQLTNSGFTIGYAGGAVIDYHHRPGVRAMLHQHYLYGRGMSEVLKRYGVPGNGSGQASGLQMLRPNGQKVARRTAMGWLRRGAIGAGRLRGMIGSAG